MKWSIRIATLIGIPIYLHLTFLLILPVFAWIFATQSVPVLGFTLGFGGQELAFVAPASREAVRWTLGTLAAIFFFGSVLLHELGHSWVAKRKYDTPIRAIVLIIFGGISQMEEVPRDPRPEFHIAIAGPLVNFVIGGVGFGALLLPGWDLHPLLGEAALMVGLLVFYNVLLGLFNLVPAFPMDGGRILRAGLARRMSYIRATETATSVGKAFAFAFGIVGLLVFNPFLILIAFFVWLGAGEEERLTKLTLTLEGVWVEDIMTREVATVEQEATVNELLEKMARERHMGYPVVKGGLIGIVTFNDAANVPPDRRDAVRVGDICKRVVVTVGPRDEAMDAMRLMSRHDIGRLVVMEDGEIVGIVTRSDLVKAVNIYKLTRGI